MIKNIYYKIDDHCETPSIVDDLGFALEVAKTLLEGIDVNYSVSITKIDMTEDEYNKLPEL